MRLKKKSTVMFIMILLLVILILLTGLAYAYFATDIFKSNKELFFQYITQIGEENNGFIETPLKEYFEKQQNMAFANEGKLTLDVKSEKGTLKEFETMNQFNVSFSGQTDKRNHLAEQNISLNYSDEVTFPINYRKIGDTIGLQTKYVSNKYITIDLSKLENQTNEDLETVNKFLGQSQELGNLLQLPFTKEEWKQLEENYKKVLKDQLKDDQFSKIEDNTSKGYKLTLTSEETKNLLMQLLEALKNDPATIDKINELITKHNGKEKLTTSKIDKLKKDLEKNWEKGNCEISVYQEKGKTTKVIFTTEEGTIQLEKKKEENSLQYSISYKKHENQTGISFSAKYIGLATMQKIQENYELEILQPSIEENIPNEPFVYKYQFSNLIDFEKEKQIEEFSDENAMNLNDHEEEEVNNFLEQVRERIEKVNKQQMEKLGLEENQNPLLQMFKPLLQNLIDRESLGTINANNSNISEIEINTWNQKFENYESTNLQGVTVKGLLTTIQLNNESQEDTNKKIKEIHFDGEEYEVTDQNIVFLKSSVETEKAYRVEFERNENTGIIYRAVINKR